MQKKSGFSVSCYFLSIAIIFVTSRYRVTFSKDVSQYLQQHNLVGPQSGFYTSTTGPQLQANRLLTKIRVTTIRVIVVSFLIPVWNHIL